MKTVIRLLLGLSALAMAGCTQLPGASLGKTFYAEPYLAADHGGPGFTGALASEYTELGRSAAGMVRWMNATAYITKAEQAEAGIEPAPWAPDQLGVNGDAGSLYQEVVNAVGANKAERPEACARAQAMWDQYLAVLRAEAAGATCPMTSDEARALLDEALAACRGVPAQADFIVYFAFDKATLSSKAQSTLDDVVASIQDMGASAVSIVGHTDTVGSVQYNQDLSERRARSVATGLNARGVPSQSMTLSGRSELDLARETGDGVREQLNRRAEISVSK